MTPADGAPSAYDTTHAPFKPLPMKGPDIRVDRRPDGSVVITSNHPPGEGPRSIAH
jgi:feruloyl-CoA synthase